MASKALNPVSSLTETALSGIGWNVVVVALTRVLSLIGQVVLGWLLIPEQFGVYALAVSLSSFATILRSGGIQQVAIQRGSEILEKNCLYFRYALIFNWLSSAMLLCIALPYFLKGSAIAWILIGMAISIPVATKATIYKVHLTISHRFREMSLITFWSAFIWQAGVIALATMGMGAVSFALPPVLQSLYESYAYKKVSAAAGFAIAPGKIETKDYWSLLSSTRWIMLSAAMLSLATTGDYFAVGMLTDPATVGIYFFSFQLIAAISIPLTSAFESVLPTLLARQVTSQQHQAQTCLRLLRQVMVVTLPLALLVSVSVPLAIDLLWQHRWQAAIVPAQLIALCIPAWLIVTVIRSVLEAKAMWRLRFILITLYGVGAISAAALGALFNDVTRIAAAVTSFYGVFAIISLLFLKSVEVSVRSLVTSLLAPLVLNLFAWVGSEWLIAQLAIHQSKVLQQLSGISVMALLLVIINWTIFRTEWGELLRIPLARLQKISASKVI